MPSENLWLNIIFVGSGSEKVPQVKFFNKKNQPISIRNIKLKFFTSSSFFEGKYFFFKKFSNLHKKYNFLTPVFFLILFHANI